MAAWTSVHVLYASKIYGNPQPFTTAIGSAVFDY